MAKSSGRVLTSAKSIELMEEKEQKKQEKIREKEMRRRLREDKIKESAIKPKTAHKAKGDPKVIHIQLASYRVCNTKYHHIMFIFHD